MSGRNSQVVLYGLRDMRLLITTQVLDSDDPHLGFFHEWVAEFAKHCEKVSVVCLKEGRHSLPQNVRVFSLGKEKRTASSISYAWRLLQVSIAERNSYDAVFVHMNPEYLVVCGWFWKLWNKKTSLWYAHKSVTLKLRIALLFTDKVFSVTKESFGMRTSKLEPMGHGVDMERFKPQQKAHADRLRLISVGRIAESKHLKEMLPVVSELLRRGEKPLLTFVGGAGTAAEEQYSRELIGDIERMGLRDSVVLYGPAAHVAIPELFQQHDVFLNFGTTGNMDKAGFEPLVSGLPLVTTNEAFRSLLTPYGLYVEGNNPTRVADAILHAREVSMEPLTTYVRENHSLQKLVPKIVEALT